jgi:hypothetical protein
MIEFLQNYGLWIALAGVFVAMHWFGMGCCGGRQRQGREHGHGTEGLAGKAPEGDKPSHTSAKSGSCH